MLPLLLVALLPGRAGGQETAAFVSAGRHFSFVVENGDVRAAGRNDRGQLGIGSTEHNSTLGPVAFDPDVFVSAAAAGAFHSLFLTSDGEVFATGWNRFGQLALGDTADRTSPVKISSLENIVAVGAGYAHSLFLRSDGQVLSAGLNSMGQLGDGGTQNRNSPVAVTGLGSVSSISAGYDFSYFLDGASEAWAVGNGLGGQLGDGQLSVSSQPVKALANVRAIATGESHAVFLMAAEDQQGVVKATGANFDGQLGDNTETRKSTPVDIDHAQSENLNFNAIAAGGDGSCFSSDTGMVLTCTGSNRDGQLGLASVEKVKTPSRLPSVVEPVLKMSMGDTHSLFLRYGQPLGRVLATGKNFFGELGDGTNAPQREPIEVATVEVAPMPTPVPTPAPPPTPVPATPAPTLAPTPAPTPEATRGPTGFEIPWEMVMWVGVALAAVLALVFLVVRRRGGGEGGGGGERDAYAEADLPDVFYQQTVGHNQGNGSGKADSMTESQMELTRANM